MLKTRMSAGAVCALIGITAGAWAAPQAEPSETAGPSRTSTSWDTCEARATTYADCARNVHGLVRGWIERKRDPKTHLYSRGKIWDYHNEAADHYSSLVLMAYYVAPEHNRPGGTFHNTLVNSRRLCATPDNIPTLFDLRTQQPGRKATLAELSEWLRDGLIRIVEVTGTDNIWYEEMVRLTDAMLAVARDRGGAFSAFRGHEPWGNMLQTLARLYVFSGDEDYLLAAEEIADRLLLDSKHAIEQVRYRDHGCELTPGLAELFVVESKLHRSKAESYRLPLKRLLDHILAAAAQPATGLFSVRSEAGDQWLQPADTWGYVLFAYENYDRATGDGHYRPAIEKPLRWLLEHRADFDSYKQSRWPRAVSADDWSDSYESMVVLWNRYPQVGSGFAWLDWATLQHVHRRPGGDFGPYTGGHFDGSTGRTLCIHMMLCSQGVRAVPFQPGVGVGALQQNGTLLLTVRSDAPYSGKLCFDGPRTEYRQAAIDWARINEMPQWYVVRPEAEYSVTVGRQPPRRLPGRQLLDGIAIEMDPQTPLKIHLKRVHPERVGPGAG